MLDQVLSRWDSEGPDTTLAIDRCHEEVLMEGTCRFSPVRQRVDQFWLGPGMLQYTLARPLHI